MPRTSGYRYAKRKDGTRYRVYGGRRTRGSGYTKSGYGAPYKTPRRQSAATSKYAKQIPRIKNTSKGVIVRHKEYIMDIPGSVDFQTEILPINPGMIETFPWLARVAQNFEEWLPRGMVFEYRTTSSDTLIAASPALGSVIMATQYNSVNGGFVSKQDMENYEGAVSCKPSVSCLHSIECKKSRTVLDEMYIRTVAPPPNADIRMYDLGKFQIATVGGQLGAVGAVVGELWVSYEVELRKPKVPADPAVGVAHFQILGNANNTSAHPFGLAGAITVPTTQSTWSKARLAGGAGSGIILLGPEVTGLVMITVSGNWSPPGDLGNWNVNLVRASAVALWQMNTQSGWQVFDPATATAQTTLFCFTVRVDDVSPIIEVTNSAGLGAVLINTIDVFCIELPDTLN